MSPKKSVKNPSAKRKITEKMPKRTVKKEKSKLNMPVNLKVSIPFTTGSSEAGIHIPIIRGRGTPRFKKHLDLETKVELANSVARLQLQKQETPPIEIVTLEGNVKSPKKRSSRSKVVSTFFQDRVVIDSTEGVVSSTVTKETEKKVDEKKPTPPRRIVTRKRLADSTAQNAAKRQKVTSNEETEKVEVNIKLENNLEVNSFVHESNPVVQPQPVVKQPKPIVDQPQPEVEVQQSVEKADVEPQPTDVKPKSKTSKPKSVKRPTAKKPKPAMKQPGQRKKKAPKGKEDIVRNKSPSLLDWLTKLPKQKESELKIQPDVPKPVDSRKASVSSNSNLSWTKDISSSSTTTCITVSSNDFVRFNKKLPVLKLTNIDSALKKRNNCVQETVEVNDGDDDSSTSSDSSSDCTNSETKFSDHLHDPLEVNSLHLSASSPPSSRISQIGNKDNTPDYTKAAEKLSSTLKKLDMEIINWMSSENEDIDPDLEKFKDKMSDILDTEFGIITHCRRLKEILDPPKIDDIIDQSRISKPVEENTVSKDIETAPVEEMIKEVEFVKPRPCPKLSTVSEVNAPNAGNRSNGDEGLEDDELANNARNYSYDHHDDDDTLSLFAESITGFESSRMNASIASVSIPNTRPVEEYVPQPITENFVAHTEKHTYCPTKISEETENMASKIKTICEKQNADSTSIYKQSNSTDDAESYQDFNENIDLDARIGPPEIKRPRLMETYFEIVPKTRSVVFGNLCFYNLMNCCRKMMFGQCRFLHVIPSFAQIKAKLKLLDERMLIQEYLLLRNWMELRRRYGMCYVEECAKRGLTRVLVEMAYDFIIKARNDSDEDTRLRVNTIEVTLLHLNTVDLSVCEDLLKLTIHSDHRTLLCDVFMATMSITQNFSRFKVVFLNLTYFMVDNDRTFNKDVVEHFLERVCILPFEEAVARALIQMMRLTKSEIFNNSMIGHFEKQISVNKDVFEEYTLLKNQCAFTSMLASAVVSSPPLKIDAPSNRSEGDGQPPAASPDTTNLDRMNKTEKPPQPLITRTIGMNPPIIFSRTPASSGNNRVHGTPKNVHESSGPSKAHDNPGSSITYTSSGSSNSDDTVNARTWRNRSIFPHLRPPPIVERPPMRAPVRTPLRPPMRNHVRPPQKMPFNQRLVTYRSPVNYMNRLPGPKY